MSKVKDILQEVIRQEVVKVATDPTTDMSRADVGKVVDKLTPVIENATNNEPWYKSRVTIGALVAIAASFAGYFGYTPDTAGWTETALALAPIAGGALTLLGRYIAKWRVNRQLGIS